MQHGEYKGLFSSLCNLQKDETELYFSYSVGHEDPFSPFHISEDRETPEAARISIRDCDHLYFAEGIKW